MTPETSEHEALERILEGAATAIDEAKCCWLVTEAGGVHARPMGFVSRDLNKWILSFVTDGRSRKVSQIRRTNRVLLLVRREADDAFVGLSGEAELCDDPAEIARRWKRAFEAFFPSERDRSNAVFLDLNVDRMELWIRGVTPEPFGLRTTILTRDGEGAWRRLEDEVSP